MEFYFALDQELTPYCYSSCFSFCWGSARQKSRSLHRFKLDRDEIWQDCSSSKCASIDWQSCISDMMPYFQDGGPDVHPPLSNAYAAVSALCSLARQVCLVISLLYALQFLIHSTFLLVVLNCWTVSVCYVM